MYELEFYKQKQKEHFQNVPSENTNANAGLLAEVQLCRVPRSEQPVRLHGYKLGHDGNENHTISLSHHLVSRHTVPGKCVCALMCFKLTQLALTDRFWQCSMTHTLREICVKGSK